MTSAAPAGVIPPPQSSCSLHCRENSKAGKPPSGHHDTRQQYAPVLLITISINVIGASLS